MLKQIQSILQNTPGLDGFKIITQQIDGYELFFIRRALDMNRAKSVTHYQITVYKDFEAEGTRYKGSATTRIHPTMHAAEIQQAVEEAILAAGFVKNKYFPLAKPTTLISKMPESNFRSKPLVEWLADLTKAIYSRDTMERGNINSAELFLNQIHTRIINSEGIDLSSETYQGELEFISDWREDNEAVELYQELQFADFNPERLADTVQTMLHLSREKALAQSTPALKKHTVLLTGEPVRNFLRFYYDQTAAKSIYEEISTWQPGQSVQGEAIQGDPINLTLDPFIQGSTASHPFDRDGLPLERTEIIKNGQLLRYWGDQQYSFYLNAPPTGAIGNLVFTGGSKSLAEMQRDPYLEIAVFSDFQMDSVTGDFGGEIRLGWYFDGIQTIPVTGGSISGNIREVQKTIFLSKELQTENDFIGPQTVQLFNLAVTGRE